MKTAASAVALLMALTACDAASERTLTVFAAASLTGAFGELESAFERKHPDVDVRLSLGGSSRLAEQIVEGAPADVYAAADEQAMTAVTDAAMTDGEPSTFATNSLTIAVAAGNPEGIERLADLGGLTLVMCSPQVPCGRAAVALAEEAGVTLRPSSEEPDVKSVLGKVAAGEADAGLVYVTDVRAAADKVDGVPVTASEPNRYPIAVLRESPERDLAAEFVEFVLSDDGQRVLREAGFGAP